MRIAPIIRPEPSTQVTMFRCPACKTLVAAALALAAGRCGSDLFQNAGTDRPTLNLNSLGFGEASTHYETSDNQDFALAEKVPLDDASRVIRGYLDDTDDVDLYDLGSGRIGDRVIVDLTATPGTPAALAIFDGTGRSMLINDHRNVFKASLQPFVDVVLQRDAESIYIAVTNTPGFTSTGEYGLLARKETDQTLPAFRPDTVLLVFDGGQAVSIGGRPAIDVPRFDAGSISDDYADLTDDVIEEIVARVREDFYALDITVLSTHEGDFYQPGMTRLYFGQYDPALLGVAEGVDEFNMTRDQRGIVFTETFAAFNRLKPSVEDIAQAMANVASHEIGHLLGLVHTSDTSGIMDVTAGLKSLMQDQSFTRSPVYQGVFPIGDQDAARYLLDYIGGDELAVRALQEQKSAERRTPHEPPAQPARTRGKFSTCCLQTH